VDNILTNTLLPEISRMLLTRMAEGVRPSRVNVTVGEDSKFAYEMD
jgi:type VI secretion system protein VasG